MGLLDTFELGYATASDGACIAYGVRPGPGPDIVFLHPTYSFETIIESGSVAGWWETFASLGRVIAVDLRGIGRSDPMPPGFTLDQRVSDAVVVLNAVGSSAAVICGGLLPPGGSMALLFAALHLDRTASVIAAEATARYLRAEDYPCGVEPAQHAAQLALLDQWGSGTFTTAGRPFDLVTDPGVLRTAGRIERRSASPASARAAFELNCQLDLRHRLGDLHVPVLVVHHRGRGEAWREGRDDLARRIPHARFVEVGPTEDEADFGVRRELARFIGGSQDTASERRSLTTILVTDIVNSTDRLATLGDTMWRTLIDEHDRIVTEQVELAGGRVIKFMGDGAMAVIPLPSRALHCAQEIMSCLRSSQLEVRSGLHLGEVDLRGDDISGLAVNLAARVAAVAASGEVLVTRAVAGALVGTRQYFGGAGHHRLKGIPGDWELLRVAPQETSASDAGSPGLSLRGPSNSPAQEDREGPGVEDVPISHTRKTGPVNRK